MQSPSVQQPEQTFGANLSRPDASFDVPAVGAVDAGSLPVQGGEATALSQEQHMADQKHRQHPIMSLVAAAPMRPPRSAWRQEADVAHQAGVQLRTLALTLSDESELRGDLLASAESWLTFAALRGVTALPPSVAALPQSG
jgi:hypothetical protein